MAPPGMKERNLEEEVVAYLVSYSGYHQSEAANFDLTLGVDSVELFAFLQATQRDKLNQLVARYGGDGDKARRGFATRVSGEISKRGMCWRRSTRRSRSGCALSKPLWT